MKRVVSVMVGCISSIMMFWSISVSAQVGWSQNSWPQTDFLRRSVELGEIRGGGPPKDGIPAIDSPNFDNIQTASSWINALEPVIAVEVDGIARAYPLQILTYHEIVNDKINDTPLTITFCPLCNSSIVFDRRNGAYVLDFGTTGLLRMSDLVMYDRQTESWWQQFSGKAIIGQMVGAELKRIPSAIVSFDTFSKGFPDGMVLNRDTGHSRPYGRNPYAGYDRIDQTPFLFDRQVDDRLLPMERVLTVSFDKVTRAYPFELLKRDRVINDEIAGNSIVIFAGGELYSTLDASNIVESRHLVEATAWGRIPAGASKALNFEVKRGQIHDTQTGSQWNALGQAIMGEMKGTQLKVVESGVYFAFAWLAFHPDTEIYR